LGLAEWVDAGRKVGVEENSAARSTLSSYLRILRRRAWVVILCALLVPLAAYAFSTRQTDLYSSQAEVYVNKQNLASAITGIEDSSLLADPARVAETQANLAQTPTVARRTLATLHVENLTPDQLLDETSVAPKGNSDLLTISVRNADPRLAVRLAGEYARQFVAFRAELDTASVRKAQEEVQRKLAELRRRGQGNSSLYRSLEEKDQELATLQTLSTERVSIVRDADEAVHVAPRPVRDGGVGLAFAIDAVDTRIRSAGGIGEQLRLPLLARVPPPPRRLAKASLLVTLAQPGGAHAETYRMLRTNLQFTLLDSNARSLLVTSATPGEGKSTTAANLAVVLARGGKHVALVDLDLRRPYLARFFGMPTALGVSDVALGRISLEEALQPIDLGARSNGMNGSDSEIGSLSVLVSGPIPPNPGEFAGSRRLAAIVDELRARFEIVLIDSPPLLGVGDAMTLSSDVDAIVLVTRLNVVRKPMLAEVRRLLDSSPAPTLGVVVTGADPKADEAYSYGYGYEARAAERRHHADDPVGDRA